MCIRDRIDGESESTFSHRRQALDRSCQGVFTEAELVSHFVKGLRTAIRTRVQNMIRTLPTSDRTNIHVVTSLSENEGRSQRAQAEATLRASRSSGGGGGRAKQVTFFVGDGDEDTSQTTDSTFDMPHQSRAPLLESPTLSPDAAWIVEKAIQLHHIMHLTAKDV